MPWLRRRHLLACSGARVTVTVNASGLYLTSPFGGTSVRVIQADIPASSYQSYVHVVDGLLIAGQDPGAPAPPPPLYAGGSACRRHFALAALGFALAYLTAVL